MHIVSERSQCAKAPNVSFQLYLLLEKSPLERLQKMSGVGFGWGTEGSDTVL
jgi:hypothetical protein